MTVIETVYVKLALTTAAGPVTIHKPIECLIIDGGGEFLLGKEVLNRLGIDIDRQLEMLAAPSSDDGDDTKDDPKLSDSRDEEEIKAAVEDMLKRAVEEGFPAEKLERLRAVIYMYDIWRVKLGNDPPARVEPLKVRLKKTAVPYKSKARKYSPELQQFLEEFNDKLVKMGWVYENPNARWACPALPVKKSGGREYRQTTDYKPTNMQLEPLAGVMPNLDVDLERVMGCVCFGLFDFIKGYWQLPLDEASQEILSYMTHRKIYTPRRVPQRCSDAALYFQSTMERCFAPLLYEHLLVWIDDLLLYAKDVDTYLDKLQVLFELVEKFGFKLSATKSCVYKTEVKWCGKLINGDGVRHDPARIAALTALPYPSNAGELQQFICSTNWMRNAIVDYARRVRPLQDKLDAVLAEAKKRTKRAASRIPITLTRTKQDAFEDVKQGLADSATLAFPKADAETCLLTDASDVGWSVIVTQVPRWNGDLPVQEQDHEMLICVGGSFTGAQRNWSVIEKEAYPIVTACEKLSYLLMRPKGFKMFCDHRNLIHVFAPGQEIKKHVRGKLLRWSMKLMEYRYAIEHIDGVRNVWADMISRWAGVPKRAHAAIKRVKRKRRRVAPTVDDRDASAGGNDAAERPRRTLRPFEGDDFEWPTIESLRQAQQAVGVDHPRSLRPNELGLLCKEDRIWIPESARDLVYRLMVIAHCGPQGHRGRASLMTVLQRRFWIANLRQRVDHFLANCLLCKHVKGGKMVRRPWSETFKSQERNEALHWDFVYLGKSYGNYAYLLVLKDDATHFCELVPCVTPTSTVAAEAILDWHSRYGAPRLWISDSASHFKNEVLQEISERLGADQHTTIAYSPWKNGSVERVNRDIKQVLRAMCLEFKVDIRDWTYFIPVLQASLNHTPVPSLGNHAPVEVFCVLPAASPLDFVVDLRLKKLVDIGQEPEQIKKNLEDLRESARLMHKAMDTQRSAQAERNQRNQRYAVEANFDVGDFVLRSRVDEKNYDTLLVTWVGPYQIVAAEEDAFRVKHLVNGSESNVHASRLKFYADSSFEVTEEIREHVGSQGLVLTVEELVGHRWNPAKKDFEFQVSWRGLEPIEDTWESFKTLSKDIPAMIKIYAAGAGDEGLLRLVAKLP